MKTVGRCPSISDAKNKTKPKMLFDEKDKIELFKQSTISEQLQRRMNVE